LIICSDKNRNATASEIASRIGLTSTDATLVHPATATDIASSVSLLRTVVKASAFCLQNFDPPPHDRARTLWSTYQASLDQVRAVGSVPLPGRAAEFSLKNRVIVPVEATFPAEKYVAKVDLAQMATAGTTPAYPDPLLVAYKTSVNWTRLFAFQLIAEAEPRDIPQGPRGPDISLTELSVQSEVTT
jgi:hypothetical protein